MPNGAARIWRTGQGMAAKPSGCSAAMHLRLRRQQTEELLETWRVGFEHYEKRKPGAEDDLKFRETTIRDIVWEWRDVLPPDRRAALDRTVAEFGDPDAWKNRYFAHEEPSLSRVSMQQQPVEDTVVHLASWQPNPEAQGRTDRVLRWSFESPQLLLLNYSQRAQQNSQAFGPSLSDICSMDCDSRSRTGRRSNGNHALNCWRLSSKRTEEAQEFLSVPGDDADWSWALQSGIEWLAAASGGAQTASRLYTQSVLKRSFSPCIVR